MIKKKVEQHFVVGRPKKLKKLLKSMDRDAKKKREERSKRT